MATSDLKWLDEDFSNYGVVQLDSQESHEEPLTLKPAPEIPPPVQISKPTLESSFQVDTDLVLSRLKRSLWPFKYENFFEGETPDLYSPFWITTTLVLVLLAASNSHTHTIYGVVSIPSLFYSLSLAVPGVLYCLLSNRGSGHSYYFLLSIFGYSWVYFVVAAVVSFLPYFWLRVATWLVSAALSVFFLKHNLWAEVERVIPTEKYIVLGIVIAEQLIIILFTNISFLGN
jgi:hypothetical protein